MNTPEGMGRGDVVHGGDAFTAHVVMSNHEAARFWGRIFGINFAVGVVTGIPMEFQFGTNWARFSRSAGAVIGQTLAMEGVFSFFLECFYKVLINRNFFA